jgi:hypothetical protein
MFRRFHCWRMTTTGSSRSCRIDRMAGRSTVRAVWLAGPGCYKAVLAKSLENFGVFAIMSATAISR